METSVNADRDTTFEDAHNTIHEGTGTDVQFSNIPVTYFLPSKLTVQSCEAGGSRTRTHHCTLPGTSVHPISSTFSVQSLILGRVTFSNCPWNMVHRKVHIALTAPLLCRHAHARDHDQSLSDRSIPEGSAVEAFSFHTAVSPLLTVMSVTDSPLRREGHEWKRRHLGPASISTHTKSSPSLRHRPGTLWKTRS